MSLTSIGAAAAASPTINFPTHNHKKGGHAGHDATESSSTRGPATNQSLLSSLFESIEQVIGISLAAPQPAAGVSAGAVANAAASANVAASANGVASKLGASFGAVHPFNAIGVNVDAKA
jgi:hypothetical protein